jgi:hypothetical protein|tara:strand:- start:356 stop:622 length:267 start_codon:yes stop_codon:yes gene_type:complete
MIKNILKSITILLFFIFLYFIVQQYFSDANINKTNNNRKNIINNLIIQKDNIVTLKNDTNNIIEYNSGYNNDINKPKRKFWNLIRKND